MIELGDNWMWRKKAKEEGFKDDARASDSETQVNGEIRNNGGGGSGFEG